MHRNLKIALFGVFFSFMIHTGLQAQDQQAKINWMSIEEAEALSRTEPRKIFVDVYTDWCSWCRRMSSETFTHPVIIEYINRHFYAVKLNAEQTDPIVFRGTTYENENIGQRRATHSFAIALLRGRMSYPSVAFFDEDLNLITAIPGFRPPDKMEAMLSFFKNDVFKDDADLDAYMSSFKGQIGSN